MTDRNPPPLKFTSFVGFYPEELYEVGPQELWEYQTIQSDMDSNGNFTLTMKLKEPKRLIVSRDNAHP